MTEPAGENDNDPFLGVDPRTGRVLVVGLGRFGTAFAQEAAALGYDVVALDQDEARVADLADVLDHCLQADGSDPKVLEEIDVSRFDLAVVSVATDLETSTLAVSALAEAGVPNVWAKATSSRHANILRRVGAHRTVQPETVVGSRMAHQLAGGMLEYLQLDETFCLVETDAPTFTHDRTLGELDLRGEYRVTVVAAKCSQSGFVVATADTYLSEGSLLVVAGTPADTARFARLP